MSKTKRRIEPSERDRPVKNRKRQQEEVKKADLKGLRKHWRMAEMDD